ncbi:MAG TPA: trypsin-like peptidase domain-containing protein [Microlunatus sp.]|nr:trypsin-like peptidase domain-containing protein [Microlunatus sp.]
MSGDEMTDEDRSAAPDDGRSVPEDSGSDWFFRDRSGDEAQVEPSRSDEFRAAGYHPTEFRPDQGGSDPEATPGHYYGPFGGPAPQVAQPTEVLPPYGAGQPPTFAGPTGYPVAGGVPPLTQRQPTVGAVPAPTPVSPPPTRPARRSRTGLVLLMAALLAALVGSAAGYGGARLAQSSSPNVAPTVPARPSASARPTTSTDPAPTPVPAAPGQIDTVQVAASALPSTVMIRVGSSGSGATGSGFVLDAEGHIMTNNHVIADAADGGRITVMFSDGARVRAELVGRSPSYDLAVIKLTGSRSLTPLPVGDSDTVQVGEPVVAIGSPLALASTVTQGIVSAKNRPVVVSSAGGADSPSAYINGIQTDAAINPGNSGGPLVDAAARVIGVNSAILTLGQSRDTNGNIGIGFAIPINQAMEIGKLLIDDGKATYPVIGVNVGEADSDGVRLSQVDGDGPADRAGLQVDDVVTAIDQQPVTTSEELIVAVRTHRPGDQVTLTYERGGQQRTAEVTLGSREG